ARRDLLAEFLTIFVNGGLVVENRGIAAQRAALLALRPDLEVGDRKAAELDLAFLCHNKILLSGLQHEERSELLVAELPVLDRNIGPYPRRELRSHAPDGIDDELAAELEARRGDRGAADNRRDMHADGLERGRLYRSLHSARRIRPGEVEAPPLLAF